MPFNSLKFRFVLIATLLISVVAGAKDYPISLDWKLNEHPIAKTKNSVNSLSFIGSQQNEGLPSIPIYVNFFPISKETSKANVTLINPIYESITLEAYLSDNELEEINSNIEITQYLAMTRKMNHVHLTMIPIRKNRNGGYEILKSATIRIVEVLGKNNSRGFDFAQHSKLKGGEWYKISTSKDGIYKLDYNFLNSLGINVSNLSSDQISIYGNGGEMLPFENSVDRKDDLQINAIRIVDGGDGQFNPNDYILFYAKGPDTWLPEYDDEIFTHKKHLYSNKAYYFIGIGVDAPVQVSTLPNNTETENITLTSFNARGYHEVDNISLNKSGRELYGEKFDITTQYDFNSAAFQFPNIEESHPATVKIRVINVTTSPSIGEWSANCNGQSINFNVNGIGTDAYHDVGIAKNVVLPLFNPTSDNLSVSIQFNKELANEEGYLDYIEINARRALKMHGSQMSFRDIPSVGNGNNTKFEIENGTNITIWDVTDPNFAQEIPLNGDGDTRHFVAHTDSLREFIAFKSSGYLLPTAIGAIPNQDLHGLELHDMIILTAPIFQGQVEALADFHRGEGLSVIVVTPQAIYNEFSSGNPDITAIKSFCKMFYDRSTTKGDLLSYLLIVGDATYLNNTVNPATSPHILSYQSQISLDQISSFVTDDYFGFLDDNEGEGGNNTVDVGIGRFPVTSSKQLDDILNKIKVYTATNSQPITSSCFSDDHSVRGDWRSKMLFIADDGDGTTHVSAGNVVAQIVEDNYPSYNNYKVFIDAYQQVTTTGGERYPLVEKDIRESIERGVQIVTYFGHGGEVGWAHERILDLPTINEFTNLYHLPLFLTATCEFSRYDDPERISAGEQLLFNPNGGAIALMSTSRPVTSNANLTLAKAFYNLVLEKDASEIQYGLSGPNALPHGLRLGDINRVTKNGISSSSNNKRNFVLLGDPALRLAYPQYVVEQDLIADEEGIALDTISALQRVTVHGHVEDLDGNLLEDFNGYVTPTVFDKPKALQTLVNDPGSSIYNFNLQTNVLYKGNVSVENGNFSYSFIVPKDISYQEGLGRISYYAVSDDHDAFGYNHNTQSDQSFFIGGQNEDAEEDVTGPEMEIYLDNENFVSGTMTNENPIFIAKLSDDHGINTTGTSIGHDIVLTLDNDNQNVITLNELYQADLDTYQSGSIRYPLKDLSEGEHTLTLKVWDIYNNSSKKTLTFEVANSLELVLENVVNYPNPFTTHTEFMFQHNQNCSSLDVNIQVFTVSGRLVKTIHNTLVPHGEKSNERISWNGKDEFGEKLGRGVYVYKLKVKTPSGQKDEIFQKLVILN